MAPLSHMKSSYVEMGCIEFSAKSNVTFYAKEPIENETYDH